MLHVPMKRLNSSRHFVEAAVQYLSSESKKLHHKDLGVLAKIGKFFSGDDGRSAEEKLQQGQALTKFYGMREDLRTVNGTCVVHIRRDAARRGGQG